MSDLRPDDIDLSERSSLPSDLAAISDRLTDDGVRWRRQAPDGAGLPAWTRATLGERGGADVVRHSPLAQRGMERVEGHSSPNVGSKGSLRDRRMLRPSRARGALGLAATVVVVGMIALLLTQNAYRRAHGPGGNSDATATSVSTPTMTAAPNLTFLQPGQLPVVSASDPSVVYKLASGALQRSVNGGKTYSTEALPKSDLSQIDDTSVAVSPLDAAHVFVTFSGRKDTQVCPGVAPYPVIVMHGGIDAGGYIPCAEEYVSADGGHTWTQPKLPYRGALGGLNSYRVATGPLEDSQYTFKASGSRLYSALAFDNLGGSLADSPGVRLVVSDDGGMTWALIDSALATSTRYICDFGVEAATGMIYAVTGDNACGGMSNPKLTLWVSANSGQRWSVLRALPTLGETGIFVGAHGELYIYEPQVTVAGRGSTTTATPADLKVSVDHGATFSSAPSAGLSADTPLTGPFATLADGSIVCAVMGPNSGTVVPMTLYAWKPGASSWRTLAPIIPGGVTAVTPLPLAAGETQQTLLVADEAGNLTQVKVPLG